VTTTAVTAPLRIGTRLDHDGARFEVVEIAGRRLVLQQLASGAVRQVDLAWLLAHPTTRVADTPGEPVQTAAAVVFADADEAEVAVRAGHVREVLTGYRHGSSELALPGEPRPSYRSGTAMMGRYEAKAAETGVSVSTLRRWVRAFQAWGPAGLVTQSTGPKRGSGWGRTDARWIDMCRAVVAEQVNASRPTRALILATVEARLVEEYGEGVVPVPAKTVGYQLLRELFRGSNAFTGSTKGKRSIADRPHEVYGRLRATRPGEYVLLDTTKLDVFAMEPVTCRWVQAELTASMDLYDRCICGLRLTPVSTKAVDVAGVLYETVHPRLPGGQVEALPAHGVPGTVVLDARKLVDAQGQPLLPSVAAETIVYDHGQIYVSQHVESVCARFGISLQPARPRTPTDKSPLERWFKTLSEGLLVALPGYKGADVHSRGLDVEAQAFFFLDELEAIIREWVGLVYHCRPHRGMCIPEVPGLEVSPLEMFTHGINRAGYLSIPTRPDLAYDFLATVWTSIQHYGVEINGLRYDGRGLNGYRNRTSPYAGVHAGRWPIAVDPGDVRAVYFQHPDDHTWHTLDWEHAPALDKPFSSEALTYARRLAARTQRFPDTATTLAQLLHRWGAGLTDGAVERRMAVRLSQQRLRLLDGTPAAAVPDATPAQQVSALPSVRRLNAIGATQEKPAEDADPPTVLSLMAAAPQQTAELGGDDDEDAELDDAEFGSEDDFYADVMDSR
jgi:transposase InsO family protein